LERNLGVESLVAPAVIAQLVEHHRGKVEVSGSNPDGGSMIESRQVIWEDPDELGYRLIPAEPEVPDLIFVDDDGTIIADKLKASKA
jgi:hypothetical protein